MRERARIVLLAAGGLGSRAIGRTVGCTPGTASKWRVRYARDTKRFAATSLHNCAGDAQVPQENQEPPVISWGSQWVSPAEDPSLSKLGLMLRLRRVSSAESPQRESVGESAGRQPGRGVAARHAGYVKR